MELSSPELKQELLPSYFRPCHDKTVAKLQPPEFSQLVEWGVGGREQEREFEILALGPQNPTVYGQIGEKGRSPRNPATSILLAECESRIREGKNVWIIEVHNHHSSPLACFAWSKDLTSPYVSPLILNEIGLTFPSSREADSEIPAGKLTFRDFENEKIIFELKENEVEGGIVLPKEIPQEIDLKLPYWIQLREWQRPFRDEPKKPVPYIIYDLFVPWNLMEKVWNQGGGFSSLWLSQKDVSEELHRIT